MVFLPKNALAPNIVIVDSPELLLSEPAPPYRVRYMGIHIVDIDQDPQENIPKILGPRLRIRSLSNGRPTAAIEEKIVFRDLRAARFCFLKNLILNLRVYHGLSSF